MRRPRVEPRINLRFEDLEEMDAVELVAIKDGLDLQEWLRKLVRDELKNRGEKHFFIKQGLLSILTVQAIVEQLADQDTVKIAREKATAAIEHLTPRLENL